MRRTPFVSAALVAIVLLSGCASVPGEASPPPAVAAPGPVAVPTPAEVVLYDCNGRNVTQDAFVQRAPLSSLGEDGRRALEDVKQRDGYEHGFPAEDGWFVVAESATHIELLSEDKETRVLEPYELAIADVPPDHWFVALEKAANPGEEPAWMVSSSSPCALRLDYVELEPAQVRLASAPDPSSDKVDLLVTEARCNSGEDAEGRIQLVALKELDDRVEVALATRPRETGASCQSNPETPFSVSLSEPLGGREVIDIGLVMPRPVTVGPKG